MSPFRPRRLGCLGSFVALATIAPLVYLVPVALFAPWAYSVGGGFHVLPMWQAWGRMHSPAEGDYLLYINIYPVPGRRPGSGVGGVSVSGSGRICSPHGVISKLTIGGGMDRDVWANADGRTIHLYLHRLDVWSYAFDTDRRPSFDLYGAWHYPVLDMDDRGTVSQAFNADGSVNRGRDARVRWTSHVTLHGGSYAEFEAACRAGSNAVGIPRGPSS
jgi:hypothetical protein